MAALRITNICLFMQDKISGGSLLFPYIMQLDLVANFSVMTVTIV